MFSQNSSLIMSSLQTVSSNFSFFSFFYCSPFFPLLSNSVNFSCISLSSFESASSSLSRCRSSSASDFFSL